MQYSNDSIVLTCITPASMDFYRTFGMHPDYSGATWFSELLSNHDPQSNIIYTLKYFFSDYSLKLNLRLHKIPFMRIK